MGMVRQTDVQRAVTKKEVIHSCLEIGDAPYAARPPKEPTRWQRE